jgi:hypothetical protein
VCHFYQYITTKPLIYIKENAAAGKHVQHLVSNSGYCRIHGTQQKCKKKETTEVAATCGAEQLEQIGLSMTSV